MTKQWMSVEDFENQIDWSLGRIKLEEVPFDFVVDGKATGGDWLCDGYVVSTTYDPIDDEPVVYVDHVYYVGWRDGQEVVIHTRDPSVPDMIRKALCAKAESAETLDDLRENFYERNPHISYVDPNAEHSTYIGRP